MKTNKVSSIRLSGEQDLSDEASQFLRLPIRVRRVGESVLDKERVVGSNLEREGPGLAVVIRITWVPGSFA